MGGSAQRRSVGTAVGRLLAVFDGRADADAATQALATEASVDSGRIERYEGEADALSFDASGRRRGLRGRLYRIIEFTWADQAPDFAWYEAALREGRTVLSIPVSGQRNVAEAARIVTAHDGHFVNHFGWFETQALTRWRGPEPDVPGFLRR